MKITAFITCGLLTVPVLAMGNRPPTDPATYSDITGLQGEIDQTNGAVAAQQNTLTNQQNQIDDLNKLKIQIGTTVRLYDAKYTSLNFFSFTDIQGSGGNAVGLNVGFKLGKSYEQKLLEKQQKELDYLRSKLDSLK